VSMRAHWRDRNPRRCTSPDIGHVVVEALKFDQHGPQLAGPDRHLRATGLLDRKAECQAVADGAVARDPLSQWQGGCDLLAFEEPFDSLVDEPQTCFIFTMVSPTTQNRKCPGSMSPAWTGPTGIS